jgi:threonine dehydrogenase-like Zn-dependent dehydrogenase
MAANITPAEKIIAIDIVDSKLKIAKSFRATHIINSARTANIVAELRSLTNGLGVDRAVDTTGNIRIIQDTLLNCVAPGGIAATVGSPPLDQVVHITPATWIARGVNYIAIHQGSYVPRTVRWIFPSFFFSSDLTYSTVYTVPCPTLERWPTARRQADSEILIQRYRASQGGYRAWRVYQGGAEMVN